MKFRFRIPAHGPLCLLAGLLLLPHSLAGQLLGDDELLSNGIAAYRRLPGSVTSADATLFANAVRYLFAYEQRNPPRMQRDPALARQVHEGLAWLSRNVGLTRPAETKGDSPGPRWLHSNLELRSRGLALYGQLPSGDPVSGQDAVRFIQAFATLYAFQQRPGTENDPQVRRAVARLEGSLAQLGQASTEGKADGGGRPVAWAPGGSKPTLQQFPGVADGRELAAPPVVRLRRNEARPR
jgi:hypothetical protein